MKKLLLLVMCLLITPAMVGCAGSGPSKKQIKEDVLEEYYGGAEGDYVIEGDPHKLYEIKNFKITEMLLADKKDDKYYAKFKVTYEKYVLNDYTREYEWEFKTNIHEVEYKHYDTGGWVLEDVD